MAGVYPRQAARAIGGEGVRGRDVAATALVPVSVTLANARTQDSTTASGLNAPRPRSTGSRLPKAASGLAAGSRFRGDDRKGPPSFLPDRHRRCDGSARIGDEIGGVDSCF